MTDTRPDGGPAFPMPIASYNATGQPARDSVAYAAEVFPGGQGMSLRDWFAGQAMAGILAEHCGPEPSARICPGPLGEYACRYTDALLAELAKPQPTPPNPLLDAASALYDAGVWHCDRPVDEAGLWAALRDAMGREPGTSPKPEPVPPP